MVYSKEGYQRNKEYFQKYYKKHYQETKDKYKEYYQQNRIEILNKAWRKKNGSTIYNTGNFMLSFD
jgi:hypothetical protein